MQKAVPAGQGTMAAILGMDDLRVTELCKAATANAQQKRSGGENFELTVAPLVEPANFNAPGQIVIAGSVDAVGEAVALVKDGGTFAGSKAIALSVSAPFHCSLMRPARDRMAEVFTKSTVKPVTPVCEYVPNRTARLTREAGVVFELLIEQIDHPVLWSQSVSALLAANYAHAAEFGPGKDLETFKAFEATSGT
jgi:[acyl-carrier-protein] S-malonyltransferase